MKKMAEQAAPMRRNGFLFIDPPLQRQTQCRIRSVSSTHPGISLRIRNRARPGGHVSMPQWMLPRRLFNSCANQSEVLFIY
jgi:hypothetical protein